MRNKANWNATRTIREGGGNLSDSLGYISLNVINEDLGNVANDTWTSPTTAVQVGNAKNFSYQTGQIVYTGEQNVLVQLESYQAMIVSGGGSKVVVGTGGLNGTPCENFAMPGTSAGNSQAVAINQCRFEISQGDTLDAFVKHQEGGARDLTLTKGVYHVNIIDVI